MAEESIRIVAVDPRCEDAIQLIGALSNELAEMYDFTDNGAGDFTPEDALVARSSFLIGFIGNRPIACGAFRPLDGDTAEIKRMFVVPAWRGQGYSKVILNKLEDLAKEAGYAVIRLETGNRQPVAIRLYERSGYQRIPNYGIYTRSERSVCFEKQL